MKNTLPLRCEECNHEWVEIIILPMVVKSFVARLQGTLCPHCGSNKVDIILKRPEEQ